MATGPWRRTFGAILVTVTALSASRGLGFFPATAGQASATRYSSICRASQYVGNRRSHVLHRPGDRNLPSPHNQVCFDSLQAGLAAGYRLSRSYSGPGAPSNGTHASATAVPSHSGPTTISIPNRPRPREITYQHCPPAGVALGDQNLNLLKNRVDPAAHPTVFSVSQFERLAWPHVVSDNHLPMADWTSNERAAVYRYEGMPVTVEGYLVAIRQEGPESTNCEGSGGIDWHMWIAGVPRGARGSGVIVESTPRVRAALPGFSFQRFLGYLSGPTRLRFTGWAMLDYEHPEQIGWDRATLWEVHPITRVEAWRGNRWVLIAGA